MHEQRRRAECRRQDQLTKPVISKPSIEAAINPLILELVGGWMGGPTADHRRSSIGLEAWSDRARDALSAAEAMQRSNNFARSVQHQKSLACCEGDTSRWLFPGLISFSCSHYRTGIARWRACPETGWGRVDLGAKRSDQLSQKTMDH